MYTVYAWFWPNLYVDIELFSRAYMQRTCSVYAAYMQRTCSIHAAYMQRTCSVLAACTEHT